MKLNLDRIDCARMMLACTVLQQSLESEANDPETNEDRRTIAQGSTESWARLHDRIHVQIAEFDRKQGERLRRLYEK